MIGDIAHIEASSDTGPRPNVALTSKERDHYDNLILLCKNCHARLDGQKNSNSVEYIRQLRADHERWVRERLPERGLSTVGWKVVLLQGEYPIDLELALTALSPDYPQGDPELATVRPTSETWPDIYGELSSTVSKLFTSADEFDSRFAVFPLAPISACIALGYCLTSRPYVRLYQYHRDDQSWTWPNTTEPEPDLSIAGLPSAPSETAGELAFVFHLSATVQDSDVEMVGKFLATIHVSTPSIGTGWLQTPSQLAHLGRMARSAFETCLARFPAVSRWHVFYAGPAPGAVVVGQQINPTMSPPVQLYEFQREATPAYQASILLTATRDD